MVLRLIRSTARTVRSINRRYATPGMKVTPMVRFSLGLLRLYLLFLVGLMVYKFVVAARGG